MDKIKTILGFGILFLFLSISGTAFTEETLASLPKKQIGNPAEAFIQTDAGKVILENNQYLCRISLLSGLKWERMFNKTSGVECLSPENNSPLFMLAGSKVSANSTNFKVTGIRLSEKGKEKTALISLFYPSKELAATLTVKITDGPKINLSLSLKNDSKNSLKLQPVFPVVSRVNIDKDLKNTHYFFPWRSGVEGSIDCDLAAEYGDMGWMQVIAAFNPNSKAGIYAYPKDNTGGFKGMMLKKLSPNAETIIREQELVIPYEMPKEDVFDFEEGLGFAYYYPEKEIAPGAVYNLPETVVSIYSGGWKEPLKDYSAWAHTWYKHVDTPQWFKNCFNFLPRHPLTFYSEKEHKYIAAENLRGSEHLVQFAYWEDYPAEFDPSSVIAIDRYRPGDFEYNKHRGGLPAFKDEIKKTQELGGHFTIYIDHRFCWAGSKVGQAHGKEWATMDRPGNYTDLGTYAKVGVNGWSECFYEPNAWADYIAQTCGRIVKDTGMDGIYLDELMIGWPCYNPDHKHFQQDKFPCNPQLLIQNAVKARDAMRKENPQAILMTEHAGSDYYTQFFDGSWTQLFCSGFPFSEKYFDENSLIYFRFCFPEFKLAEWGAKGKTSERCFFNGIGIDSNPDNQVGAAGNEYLARTGQVLKENGDAFASLHPEPLVETKVKNVLANKFPITAKTVYTIYNKSGKAINQEVIKVDPRPGCHYVEFLNDNAVTSRLDGLTLQMNPAEVLCIGQLPEIIRLTRDGDKVKITLKKKSAHLTLVAFLDVDNSHSGIEKTTRVKLNGSKGEIDIQKTFGHKGKLILKLFQGELLLDEAVIAP